MKKIQAAVLFGAMALLVGFGVVGCGGGGGDNPVPAKDLNATGFWEDSLNGATAAGDITQNVANITAYLLLPPSGMGRIVGTVNGYHATFTVAWDSGSSESGSGDFSFVNNSVDKLVFDGTIPSVGNFEISWRGPNFDNHTPAGEPLDYTPPAPAW